MSNRQKRSPIWKLPIEDLRSLVDKSRSLGEVLSFWGFKNKGSNYRTLHKRLKAEGISWERFKGQFGIGRIRPAIEIENILVEGSDYNRGCLKKRLLKEGLLRNECYECGAPPVWNDKPLVMVLDHINGISNDNKLVNLRLLCPNCNSQMPTFAGRRLKKYYHCEECGRVVSRGRKRCTRCRQSHDSVHHPRVQRRKVDRPTREELQVMLWVEPTTVISKKFGVSDKAVSKWAKSYGLTKPSRGYWAKLKSAG